VSAEPVPAADPCPSVEVWRVCTRHGGYEVSDQGRVRNTRTGRVLKAAPTDRGYAKLHLGERIQVYVHQLVAEAFHGAAPSPSHQVDHKDWNRLHNCAHNLRWLPALVNRCRWKDRIGGRNIWELLVKGEPDPDGHDVMTEEERRELLVELTNAGWFD
jgi:hypothetical protein